MSSSATVLHGDCLEMLPTLAADSIDAVVTDPPYGISFCGKDWDHGVPGEPIWREVLRVLKPGGHMLAFGGTRTSHRLVCAIEDAGFEVRDCLMWLYAAGMPKSLDVGKAIDKAAGVKPIGDEKANLFSSSPDWSAPNRRVIMPERQTESAKQWDGWGTGLKPSHELVILVRKPIEGTVAANVLEHGTGALNINGCRIAGSKPIRGNHNGDGGMFGMGSGYASPGESQEGRWPTNVIFDEDASSALGEQSRFFYIAKASRREREAGLVQLPGKRTNRHPTVKPVTLMKYLCRLITPTGGTILDPFTGSGTTGIAAIWEGFQFIGIEQDIDYVKLVRRRLSRTKPRSETKPQECAQ